VKIPSLRNLASTRYLAHKAINRFIYDELKGKHFETVIDIGAGRSPYKKFINCKKYISLDIENRTGNSDVIIADINEKIPLVNDFADCVICTEVLEHIKKPQQALIEIYRILKKDGLLLITTPMVWPLHEEPNDFYRYTKYGLSHLLKEAGFKGFKIKPSNNYTYTLSQLLVTNLREKIFVPLVVLINIFALLSREFNYNEDMPLGNHIVAIKND
jgi:SAM-dependent methyltransferase